MAYANPASVDGPAPRAAAASVRCSTSPSSIVDVDRRRRARRRRVGREAAARWSSIAASRVSTPVISSTRRASTGRRKATQSASEHAGNTNGTECRNDYRSRDTPLLPLRELYARRWLLYTGVTNLFNADRATTWRSNAVSATLHVRRWRGCTPCRLCLSRLFDQSVRSSVPTVNQLVRKGRKAPVAKTKTPRSAARRRSAASARASTRRPRRSRTRRCARSRASG